MVTGQLSRISEISRTEVLIKLYIRTHGLIWDLVPSLLGLLYSLDQNISQFQNIFDYVHMVSFSLAFYIVLRPQGIRKQMKTLRKRHRVHIALVSSE